MKRFEADEPDDFPVTEDLLRKAEVAGCMCLLKATSIRLCGCGTRLEINVRGRSPLILNIAEFPEFATLSRQELGRIAVGFGGSALCLEERDLHVSVDGLLRAVVSANPAEAAAGN